jgi:hypothetical protein
VRLSRVLPARDETAAVLFELEALPVRTAVLLWQHESREPNEANRTHAISGFQATGQPDCPVWGPIDFGIAGTTWLLEGCD